jgi:hypothetical protein
MHCLCILIKMLATLHRFRAYEIACLNQDKNIGGWGLKQINSLPQIPFTGYICIAFCIAFYESYERMLFLLSRE